MMAVFRVIAVGGTGETYEGDARTQITGMLSAVTKAMHGRIQFVEKWLPYPAVYAAPGGSYATSVGVGIQRLQQAVERSTLPVILIGYSQGARVVGDFARVAALGMHEPAIRDRIVSVGLIADPNRAASQLDGPRVKGYGVGGERFIPPGEFGVHQISAEGDPISSLPAGNPIRVFADWSEFYSPGKHDDWFAGLRRKHEEGKFQKILRDPLGWFGATAYLKGYLFDRRHTSYHVERVPGMSVTFCQFLADLLVADAREWERRR